MIKKGKVYILLILLTIAGIMAIEMTKPKKVNWFPSYAGHHKIPFGSLVFTEQLKTLANDVIEVDRPPFEFLNNNDIQGSYMFYNGGIAFGEAELNALLDWTAKGNTLVVSAVDFEEQLLDTLNLKTESINLYDNFDNIFKLQLVNYHLDKTIYKVAKANSVHHFFKIDSSKTKILGVIDKLYPNSEKSKATLIADSLTNIQSIMDSYEPKVHTLENPMVNVVRQPFGDGEVILSLFPQAFTNYFMLKSPNQNYTVDLLGYLNLDAPIYLDQHYKSGKKFYTSPMYLFLNTKELKWAYYIVLIGVVFYIIFEGKRKQRAIPILKPLKNQTVSFTRTISDMYYHNNKHKALSEHKIQHFLEYTRSHLYLNTSDIDAEFIKNLAARSNNTLEDTEQLFQFIKQLNGMQTIDASKLERLNSLIETFKSKN